MKIGWFTPCADGSAVAGFSAAVVAALVDLGQDPVPVRIDEADRPDRAFAREVVPWRSWPYLNEAGMLFYNIGDDFRAFAPVADLIRRRPGIAVLHDATLAGYFAAHAAARGIAEPPLDPVASIERIAALAIGTVLLGGTDEAAEAASRAGPFLHLRDAREPREIAARLAAFADEVAALAPLTALAGQLAEPLADMGVGRGDPVVARLAAAAESLFAVPPASA